MLLEVERDLFVADLREQRTHDEPRHGGGEGGQRGDPEREDGRGREAQRFEGDGGADEDQRAGHQRSQQAADQQLAPPAEANLAEQAGDVARAVVP